MGIFLFFELFQRVDCNLWWLLSCPLQYPESQKPQAEDEHQQQPRWKEDRDRERDRKIKDDRARPKDSQSAPKEDGKEGSDLRITSEDHRAMSKDSRSNPHMQFSSPLAQHQGYMPYMHGYPYGQGYDPNHPGYRGMPSVMMQNYPGTSFIHTHDGVIHFLLVVSFVSVIKTVLFKVFAMARLNGQHGFKNLFENQKICWFSFWLSGSPRVCDVLLRSKNAPWNNWYIDEMGRVAFL